MSGKKAKISTCHYWFDFTTLIALKFILLLWGLAIIGIILKMMSITRAFIYSIPIVALIFLTCIFSKKKYAEEKGTVLFLFTLGLFVVIYLIDYFAETHYFEKY